MKTTCSEQHETFHFKELGFKDVFDYFTPLFIYWKCRLTSHHFMLNLKVNPSASGAAGASSCLSLHFSCLCRSQHTSLTYSVSHSSNGLTLSLLWTQCCGWDNKVRSWWGHLGLNNELKRYHISIWPTALCNESSIRLIVPHVQRVWAPESQIVSYFLP